MTTPPIANNIPTIIANSASGGGETPPEEGGGETPPDTITYAEVKTILDEIIAIAAKADAAMERADAAYALAASK